MTAIHEPNVYSTWIFTLGACMLLFSVVYNAQKTQKDLIRNS